MKFYKDFIQVISNQFISGLSTIKAEYNFDYGDEFEFALCSVLSSILPEQFGVVRGHLVSIDNRTAGDDIIIFEKSRFPTLALRKKNDFSRKEFIPIEAAYCYIEAKHTLTIKGDSAQSLSRACQQVSDAKQLIQERTPRDGTYISKYLNVNQGPGVNLELPEDFPDFVNPAYGVVMAKNVRLKNGKDIIIDPDEIINELKNTAISSELSPDLIVLGDSVIVLPTLVKPEGKVVRSPFYIEGKSALNLLKVPNKSYGIAVASLMSALDWIELGVMPWHKIIVDGLDIPFQSPVQGQTR